jgi:hypothetical protein
MNDKQFCYARLQMTGEVIAIRQGETGYFQTDYGKQSREFVQSLNDALGIDAATADAMHLCSMSGNWKAFESIRATLASKTKAKGIHIARGDEVIRAR